MICSRPDPAFVALQITALEADGTPKADVVSGTVRVYTVDALGAETEVLAATALGLGGGTTWRYVWEPLALAVGQYVCEYAITDGADTFVAQEDLVVQDGAQESTLLLVQADAALIRAVETGRWQIVANQMVFYDEQDVEILRFDLLNEAGLPSMSDVFQRVPA